MNINLEWLQDTIERINQKKKVEAVSLDVTVENENLSRFAENKMTQNTTRHRIQVKITAFHNKRSGSAQTSDISSRGLISAMRRAEAIVKAIDEDPEFISPPKKQSYIEVNRFFKQTSDYSVDDKARIIREITAEAELRKMDASGIYRNGDYSYLTANTEGLIADHCWTRAEFSLTARTDTSAGSAVATEEDISKINPQALAIEAFRTAEMARDPKPLKPGTYKTLLTARAMGEMMPFIIYVMNRRAADEGRSFFSKKLGKKIVSKKISIVSDPADSLNPGNPIDTYLNPGMPCKKVSFINEGVLENLWTDRYWAHKHKIPVIAPPFNFNLSGGDKSLDQMIRKIDKGLLVMHLWYIRYVNPMELNLTGTSRDGLFLIEDGQIKHAVQNMRFNDSLIRILKNPIALGLRERRSGAALLPSVLASDFNWIATTTF